MKIATIGPSVLILLNVVFRLAVVLTAVKLIGALLRYLRARTEVLQRENVSARQNAATAGAPEPPPAPADGPTGTAADGQAAAETAETEADAAKTAPPAPPAPLSEQLKKRRAARGLSQEALAAELGVSRQAVSKWENGDSEPSTANLLALAALYGISVDELLRGK